MKYKEIKLSYDELKEKDYDFLVVNSDQTWVNVTPNYLLDYGYLKFAEHWNIRKFIYGASYPLNFWIYRNDFNIKAGNLLKKFSGVSVREINTVSLAEKYLRVKPEFVLDPTLLIDKKYYLNLIKDYKNNYINFNYICIYQLDKNDRLNYFIENSSRILNFTIHKVDINKDNYVEDFIYCINNSRAVITDSYHGTIFSILFEKPFFSIINYRRGNTRFTSLKKALNIHDRILCPLKDNFINKTHLLIEKFTVNKTLFDSMKKKSMNFLKKNLFINY